MIDCKARSDVRQAIDDFLSDRIGATAFDERLYKRYPKTSDQTVKYAIGKLWYAYSDFDDHLVRLDKPAWGAVQRFVLLLASDAELQVRHKWLCHSSQIVAAATLVGICFLFLVNFVAALLVGGIVSTALASTRRQIHASYVVPDLWKAWPFPSLAAMEHALRRTPGFRKRIYRREIVARRTKSRFDDLRLPLFIEWPLSRVGWCMVSPIMLLTQCLPLRVSQEFFLEPRSDSAGAA